TMLAFLTNDAAIQPNVLKSMIKEAADVSFNRVSVDGDTSTNDMLCIMANGASGVQISLDNERFVQALHELCIDLAKKMARDGEGATKLIECRVLGAHTVADAEKVADTIINSPLVKTAVFGADANWGRVLCAIGNCGVAVDVSNIDVFFASNNRSIAVCENGMGVPFDEESAAEILKHDEVEIEVRLKKQGKSCAAAWGCDLTYDYVKINGDYRT
ncbi:MAG: bifunctional ornithine acetyltransferase/N-acetylglutamate synthase, partial [Clostridia bacterium]|nr:bifunctional ornithine acetyltransferase/N-acetylglutamate synthase [Clostridia bacterium]